MTKNELLRLIFAVADDIDRVFDYAETATWPQGSVDELQRLGFIRPAATGMMAPCPHCSNGHIESVVARRGADGKERYFIYCPQSLRVEVTAEMCRGWEVDPEGLARAVSNTMGLTEKPKSVVPDRLWQLGRIPWQSSTREVLLCRRLCDADATKIVCRVGQGGRAIVLVPFAIPYERVWPGQVPAVINLSRVARLGKTGLELDVVAMWEMVKDHDDLIAATSGLPLDPSLKDKAIRRHVKAVARADAIDGVLVAAYRTHGSFRKAAQALSEAMEIPISKDKVRRAVERDGGIGAVMAEANSPSVARTVASQSRDRARKVLERR